MSDIDLVGIREVVEDAMLDTCLIFEETLGTMDDDGVVPRLEIEIYTGKLFISPMGMDTTRDRSYRQVEEGMYEAGLPCTAPVPPVNAILEVLSSTWNPGLVGRQYKITGVTDGTYFSHRRLACRSL